MTILLALILGMLLGRIFSITSIPVPPTVLRTDYRPGIPVVRIDGITEGRLTGIVRGDVRVFLGENMIIANSSGAFRVPAPGLVKNITTGRVPAGMKFAASKRGTKYYPVASRSAQNLSPENRVYFRSAADAEEAGYIK